MHETSIFRSWAGSLAKILSRTLHCALLTRIQVASTWTDAFDTLLDAYEQIGEHIPLLKQYEAVFQNSSYMQKVLNLIYDDIMEFHQHAVRFFADKGSEIPNHCLWLY
jgi:hypothetical protein